MTKIILISSFCLLSNFFFGQTNQATQNNPAATDKPVKEKPKFRNAQSTMIKPLTNPDIKPLTVDEGSNPSNTESKNKQAEATENRPK